MIDLVYTRIFDPEPYYSNYGRRPPIPSDIVEYDPESRISHLRSPSLRDPNVFQTQKSSLVIAIDGACRGNGTRHARASCGVFFGSGSEFNRSFPLGPTERQTSQNAEIKAAMRALKAAGQITRKSCQFTTLVLITDSDYLVKSMSDYIFKWLRNGFKGAQGHPIVNGDALWGLHQRMTRLENDGVDVLFWRVSREYNCDADRLAGNALI